MQVGTYPTRNFAQFCYLEDLSLNRDRRAGRFRQPPHVAMRLGPYLLDTIESGMWSLRIPKKGFLLIVRTSRIFTAEPLWPGEYRRILGVSSIQPDFTKASFR